MKLHCRLLLCVAGAALFLGLVGCKKKTPIAVVPAPRAAEPAQAPPITEPPRFVQPAPIVAQTLPPTPMPAPAPVIPQQTLAQRLASDVDDAYFDYDKSDLRQDARTALVKDADALKRILADFANTTVIIEGHCDERGSAEYNVALGDRRAYASKELLTQLGVDTRRLLIISYGKERPQCTEPNEACWQKNRRVHFVAGETQRPGTD